MTHAAEISLFRDVTGSSVALKKLGEKFSWASSHITLAGAVLR